MSSTETKQGQQAVNFVVPDQGLRNRSAFEAITPSAPFSARMSGRSTDRSYQAAGKRQIAEQEMIAQITWRGIELTDRILLHSIMDLIYTGQMAMGMVNTIQDPELRAFMHEYVCQGLNYSTNTHARYIELMRVKFEEIINRGVHPNFYDKLRGFCSFF